VLSFSADISSCCPIVQPLLCGIAAAGCEACQQLFVNFSTCDP
jgi:hypothetical protein